MMMMSVLTNRIESRNRWNATN